MAENVRLTLNPTPPPGFVPGGQPAGEGPSREILERAARIVRVPDARGRTLGIKQPNLLERLRLCEIIGGANAENPAYFSVVFTAYAVVEIDGERLPPPATKRELEARVHLIDYAGFDAAARCLVDEFAASGAAEAGEAPKKAPGTPA